MKQIHLFDNAAESVLVKAGKIIFEQGQVKDEMYVLVDGEVTLAHNGEAFASLTAGALLGEMAMLEHRPHYSTAVAKTKCKLVPIDQKRFQFLVENTPYFAIDVMTIMAERLQNMNHLMTR